MGCTAAQALRLAQARLIIKSDSQGKRVAETAAVIVQIRNKIKLNFKNGRDGQTSVEQKGMEPNRRSKTRSSLPAEGAGHCGIRGIRRKTGTRPAA
jgi:hypothetical protein